MDAFTLFFMKDGCKTLKFLYQEGDVPGLGKDDLQGQSASYLLNDW